MSTAAPAKPRPACADEDPELFFPIGNTGPALLQIEEAKAVCRRCPLMESCLQGALDRTESGVWGGTDEADRRRMKRRAARQRAAA
ncbi:WhiB family transcriptional regulator (plasmid) [Streptomyces sp. WC2508]|uniref:WhiB family transcriptional regulator n=1 Tax=Streptomyces sp. WC2508 TaxID=3461405 RepID=UPI0040440545